MPEEKTKTYFLITKMTEAFRKWEADIPGPAKGELVLQLGLWQIRAQLAIAQQLSIISQHLGEIVAQAEGDDAEMGETQN